MALGIVRKFGLFGFLVLLASQASAQQQLSPAQQRALKEAQQLTLLTRVAAPCAGLVTDWELAVADFYRRQTSKAVTGHDTLPPPMVRAIYRQADAVTCDDPQVRARAQDLRDFAQRRWLVLAKAWPQAGECPKLREAEFHAAFAASLEQRLAAARPAVVEGLAAEVGQVLAPLNKQCSEAGFFDWQMGGLNGGIGATRGMVESPAWYLNGIGYTEFGRRPRYFDMTRGFTIGVGETFGKESVRSSAVQGRRESVTVAPVVKLGAACGGWFDAPEGGKRLRIDCDFVLDGEGTLKAYSASTPAPPAEVTISDPDRALADYWVAQRSELRVVNPQTREIVYRQSPDEGTKHTYGGVLDKLREFDPGYQLMIALTGPSRSSDDADPGEFFDYDFAKEGPGESQGPKSVAIVDILKAANYAFAPRSADLSVNSPEFDLAQESGLYSSTEVAGFEAGW